MAIENFPLPTDVCGILFSYAEDRTLPALGTTVDAQDEANREIVQRLVNQNLEWLKGKRLNAILRDPRFYQLPIAFQNKVWEKLDPSGYEICWAVFGYERLHRQVDVPSKYYERFFAFKEASYKAKNYSVISYNDRIDFSMDIEKVSLEAACFCYQNREMAFDTVNHNKPEDLQILAASANKMAVKSLKITGVLSDEGFEILKSSGLQIDATGTWRPVSWYFIIASIMLALAVVSLGVGLCVPLFMATKPTEIHILYLFLSVFITASGLGFVPIGSMELYDHREKMNSSARHFVPPREVNHDI